MSRRAEHRRVPFGAAAVAVGGGVLVVVRLHFDDRAPDAVDEERHADQVRGDLVNGAREEVPIELHALGGRAL
jgi:hypothetical protein